MFRPLFRWFEGRLEPFPAAEPVEPPNTLVAFCLHYTRGSRRFIAMDAVLVAMIACSVILWGFGVGPVYTS